MIKFITVDQVIEIHDTFLEEFGGLPGIRSKELLISAVETPKATMFGEFLHKSIYDKAAAYLFHIVKNHPFNDGNKRTGAISTILFLEQNSIKTIFNDLDYENFVVEVAEGKHNKEDIAQFLEHGLIT